MDINTKPGRVSYESCKGAAEDDGHEKESFLDRVMFGFWSTGLIICKEHMFPF
jgi:hypothetical protein